MENDIFDAFLEALRQVFAETGIAIESIQPEEAREAEDQVITTVGLTGEVKGIFMLRTDTASAGSLLRSMLGDIRMPDEGERLTEIEMAAFGELSNQVTGRAVTLLSGIKVECDITPPTIISAPGMKSLVPDLRSSFRRVARGPFGRISLFLGVYKPARRRRSAKTKKKG